MRLFVDVTPLRASAPFRWLWTSSLLGGIAGQVGVFAVTFQVFTITGSSLAVGGIGVCVAVPTIAFAMAGGALADRMDRRTLLLLAIGAQLLVSLGFLAQAVFAANSLLAIYALVFSQATLGAIATPARRATLRRLLPAASLAPALALMLFAMHAAQVAGPLLGGALAGGASLAWCYGVQVMGSAVSLIGVLRLPRMPVLDPSASGPLRVSDALRFLWSSPVLRGALLVDLGMTVLAVPMALLPELNAERFGGTAEGLGALTAAVAIGGVAGTLLSGPWGRAVRSGRALALAAAVWGVTVVVLGLAPELWLALAALVAMGVADVASLTLGQTLVQNATPDGLRGRVSAAEQIVQMGGPQLGGLRAGLMGALLGPGAAIVLGGAAALIAVAALGAGNRALWMHREPGDGSE